jgi:hypothetical protein
MKYCNNNIDIGCNCRECPEGCNILKMEINDECYKNNYGLPYCDNEKLFECVDKILYKCEKFNECCKEEKCYKKINCDMGIKLSECFKLDDKDCCGYTKKNDGRLSSARSTSMTLDMPPYEGDVPLNKVYSEKLNDIKTGFYKNYEDIKSGQIIYYDDNELSKPFYNPNFILESDVNYIMYKDPMGSIKPVYEKNITSSCQIKGPKWLTYSTHHREDLMSKQMNVMNQTRYMSRY